MIRIAACSSYLRALHDDESLPDLDPVMRPLCREPFRRIDRFIQLALMGSAQCVHGRELSPQAGLYVSTGIGPVGNNIIVQESLIKHHLLPKPFNFVNTLGSSTGYYVCKNLGLKGQSLFISRRQGAFEAALDCAVADLELGVVTQALVGTVEECTLPLRHHRQRQSLASDFPLAEGTHWMLLVTGQGREGRPIQLKRFDTFEALRLDLKSALGPRDQVAFGMEVPEGLKSELENLTQYLPNLPFHDSQNGATLTAFAENDRENGLFFVTGSLKAGWTMIAIGGTFI